MSNREQFENFFMRALSAPAWFIPEFIDTLHDVANFIAWLPGLIIRELQEGRMGGWEIILLEIAIMGTLLLFIKAKTAS